MQMPQAYCENMKKMFGAEYEDYLKCFENKSLTAFRVNTLKISLEQWGRLDEYSTGVVPWTEKGFYYDSDKNQMGKNPYYFAGLYYIQEPSAMIPASILPVSKGDKVLDLCAAPGGKTTELLSKLGNTGFLLANDISASRAMALAKNIQMAGGKNTVVTADTPQNLSVHFEEYFDKILIDAPCSGEGMFRREPRMMRDWEEKGPEYYSVIQKEILSYAYKMLKPGGMMVYSTCTFSPDEDERVVEDFIGKFSDMSVCEVDTKDGFCSGIKEYISEEKNIDIEKAVRIFPHKAAGEGHFAVLLKKGESDETISQKKVKKIKGKVYKNLIIQDKIVKKLGNNISDFEKFIDEIGLDEGVIREQNENFVWHSKEEPNISGIRVIYSGLPLCQWKHKIVPAHQLALTLTKNTYKNHIDFSVKDANVIKYLKGETLQLEGKYKGDILVTVDGFGLGFARGNGTGMIKNKYNPGWRYQ